MPTVAAQPDDGQGEASTASHLRRHRPRRRRPSRLAGRARTGCCEQEPGYRSLGACRARPRSRRARTERPDVVVLDYALSRGRWPERLLPPQAATRDAPGVVLYSRLRRSRLRGPGDARPGRRDRLQERARRGAPRAQSTPSPPASRQVPMPDARSHRGGLVRLLSEDLPVLGMLFARVAGRRDRETLGVEPRDVRARALRIIGEMQAQDRRHGHAAV